MGDNSGTKSHRKVFDKANVGGELTIEQSIRRDNANDTDYADPSAFNVNDGQKHDDDE